MDTTELIHNSLEWADKRLRLKGKGLTQEQKNYITFAFNQNLVKKLTIPVVGCMFYCQNEIEGNLECSSQCDHCKEYYKPLEQ